MFARHRWPGNVRELRNLVGQILHLTDKPLLHDEDVRCYLAEGQAQNDEELLPLKEATQHWERQYLLHVLACTQGRKDEAARRLGINLSTLYRKLGEYGL